MIFITAVIENYTMAYNTLSIINNNFFYFLSFSDWAMMIFRNQLFEVLMYKSKFDIHNEWDKNIIL